MKKLDMSDIKKEWNRIFQSINKKSLKLDERDVTREQIIQKETQKAKTLAVVIKVNRLTGSIIFRYIGFRMVHSKFNILQSPF
jgi:hypothetical protein